MNKKNYIALANKAANIQIQELKKIKNGRPGILGILTKEYPIITPNKVANVADKDAIFILIIKASRICSF